MTRFVVSFFTFSCLAGNAMNLDSLKVVWEDTGAPKDVRMEAFQKYIWNGFLFSKPDSAFYLCQLKFELAEELGLEKSKADALRMQGMSWVFRGEFEKAIASYQESQKTYEKVGDTLGLGRIQSNLGIVYTELAQYNEALEALETSTELFQIAKAIDLMGLPLINMGRIHYLQGSLAKAVDHYWAAVPYFKEAKNLRGLGSAYNNLAAVYQDKSDYHLAIQYYEKSLKLAHELNDLVGVCSVHKSVAAAYRRLEDYINASEHIAEGLRMAQSMNNKALVAGFLHALGQSFDDRGETSDGLRYFKESIDLYREMKNMQPLALSLSDLGTAYLKLLQIDSAEHYLFQSYDLSFELNDHWILSISAKHIADLFVLKGEYNESLRYGLIAFENAKNTETHSNIAAASRVLYEAYKAMQKDKKALEMLEIYFMYRDSIASEQNIKELARFEFKYEYEKKALADSLQTLAHMESLRLNHQLEVAQKETERNLYASGGLVLLLVTIFFFQRRANRNTLLLKEKEANYQREVLYATINSQESERRRIARDLHDEVGAMLSTIKLNLGTVEMQLKQAGLSEQLTSPARNLVDETINNVRGISKNLLPPTLEEFGLAHTLIDLAEKVEVASGIPFKKNIQSLSQRLPIEHELALFRVIQEMINNAIKHSEATEFTLTMRERNSKLELYFADNGKGFDLDAVKKSNSGKTGLGLKNLENRVGVAGGEMEFKTTTGIGTELNVCVLLANRQERAA